MSKQLSDEEIQIHEQIFTLLSIAEMQIKTTLIPSHLSQNGKHQEN
jgi:hypothetical protein